MPEGTVGILVAMLFIALVPFSLFLGKFIEVYPAQKRNIMVFSKVFYLGMLIWMNQL